MSAMASVAGFPSASVALRSPVRRRGAVAMASAPAAAEAKAATEARGKGLYAVLGLGERASTGEIKAAYRNLAKMWHPDVAGEDGAGVFVQIRRAYATLSDPTERESYDRSMGRLGLGFRQGEKFRTTRRWETDQCW